MPTTEPERLLHVIDEHWMVYIVPSAVCFMIAVLGVCLYIVSGYTVTHDDSLWMSTLLGAFVCLLVALHGFFFLLMNEYLSKIIVTTRRVVAFDDALLFKEDMLEVPFQAMKTVEAQKHGILQYFLNYGTIVFERGSKGKIEYVPHPNSAARDIMQAIGMM